MKKLNSSLVMSKNMQKKYLYSTSKEETNRLIDQKQESIQGIRRILRSV